MRIILSPSLCRRGSRSGSAILVVLILLGAMLVIIAGNNGTLNQLKREIDLIERKQLERLAGSPQPVAVPAANSTKP